MILRFPIRTVDCNHHLSYLRIHLFAAAVLPSWPLFWLTSSFASLPFYLFLVFIKLKATVSLLQNRFMITNLITQSNFNRHRHLHLLTAASLYSTLRLAIF